MADLPHNVQGNREALRAQETRTSKAHRTDDTREAKSGKMQGLASPKQGRTKIANKVTPNTKMDDCVKNGKQLNAERLRAAIARLEQKRARGNPAPKRGGVKKAIVKAGVKKFIDTGKAFCCASELSVADMTLEDLPFPTLSEPTATIWAKTADMEILAAWYSETKNHGHPVVIIVEHMDEWSAIIQTDRILGVATTADVLRRFLPSNALSRLVPCAFTLKSPLGRLESVVRAVLVDSFCAFEVSHMVFKHVHMHFLRHDLTATSFIMSLKVDLEKQCAALPVEFLEYAARLPSAESADVDLENMSNQIASGLWRFREQKQLSCVQQPSNRVLISGWLSLFTKLREQTPSVLKSILEEWKRLTSATYELHADVCAVYTTFLSRDSLNLQSTSCGRLETMASAPISPSCTNHLDTTESPLSRPSSESLIKQTSPDNLHCRPTKCTPEGAQMASPRGLRTLSKSRGTSCLNESPRRSFSKEVDFGFRFT